MNTISKRLLIVMHAPSPNTRQLLQALVAGAQHKDIAQVDVQVLEPLKATAQDVAQADAIILGTPENLGYMSGALKDFFDRVYYLLLEQKQGLPCALLIRAGHDGTGTLRAINSILTGLRWQQVQPALICQGVWQEHFTQQAEELGMSMAAGLEAGVF